MNIVSHQPKDLELVIDHAFGIHGPIRDNVLVYATSDSSNRSNNLIIYPVGSRLAAYEPSSRNIEYFNSRAMQDITALALSSNQKFVAASNQCYLGDGVEVNVFRTENRRRTNTLLHKKKITSLCFSGDSKQLIAASEGSIVIWAWKNEKVDFSASINSDITRIACPVPLSSAEGLLFSSSGYGHMRLWRTSTSARQRLNNFMVLPSQAKEQQFNFQDHTWIGQGSNKTRLLAVIMEPFYKGVVDSSCSGDTTVVIYNVCDLDSSSRPEFQVEDSVQLCSKIITIAPFAHDLGFYLGGSMGQVFAFERKKERKGEYVYLKTKHFNGDIDESFISISVCERDRLFLFSDSMCLYTVDPNELEGDNLTLLVDKSPSGGHKGGIRDMDCCMEKPLITSCGKKDRCIRVWNMRTKRCIATHKCHTADEPLTVTIHPSGYQLLVGFKDKIRLYHILVDSLKTFREMQCKVCIKIQFSTGGQYFAAVIGNDISVFSSYQYSVDSSFFLIHSFTGHVSPINSLSWASDTTLFSTGMDGNIYGWDLLQKVRIDNLNILKRSMNYTSLVVDYSESAYKAAVSTSNGMLYTLHWSGNALEDSSVEVIAGPSEEGITSICLNEDKTLLFVGGGKGSIRCYSWQSLKCDSIHSEISLHATNSNGPGISCIRAIRGRLMSAGGVDGSLFICSLKTSKNSKKILSRAEHSSSLISSDDLVLVNLDNYEHDKGMVIELEQKVLALNSDHEFAIHSKETLWKSEIKDMNKKTNEIVVAERYEELQHKHKETIKQYLADLEHKDRCHKLNQLDQEEKSKRALTMDVDRFERLQQEMRDLHSRSNIALKEQKKLFEKKSLTMKQDAEAVENKFKAKITALQDEADKSDKIFQEILDQQEEEYEMELLNLKATSKVKVLEEQETSQNIRSLLHNLNSRRDQLCRQNQDLKLKQNLTEEECAKGIEKRKQMQFDLEKVETQLRKQTTDLQIKEGEISEVREANNALENFGKTLGKKINDMEQKKAPTDCKLDQLGKEIMALKLALDSEKRDKISLNFLIDQNKMKLKAQMKLSKGLEREVRAVKRELLLLAGIDDEHVLKEAIHAAYQKHVINDSKGK